MGKREETEEEKLQMLEKRGGGGKGKGGGYREERKGGKEQRLRKLLEILRSASSQHQREEVQACAGRRGVERGRVKGGGGDAGCALAPPSLSLSVSLGGGTKMERRREKMSVMG